MVFGPLTDIQECAATLNMANTPSTTARAKRMAYNGNVQLNLHNTLIVKDLRINLISVSKITRNDRKILFRKNDPIIRDLNGEVKMIADRIGDLYYLWEAVEQVKAATPEETRIKDADLWIASLGHTDAVVNLSKGRAIGINKNTSSCDVCH
ncbi:unnamed protein product [Hermetia illucens]|uniref:Uncharacterized protein n=1 Tax=Hermetia illucens TaxID=343691 RepID=A0A7R8UG01_HERIL|nr:unnamed protein product [Hermetia illucens]